MTPVYIGLGSNLGDRAARIQEAVTMLGESIRLCAVSPLYETAPMYVEDQPPYLNGALAAETDLGPLPLLQLLKRTETRIGRLPRDRYGPREIDLDLLAYGTARYTFVNETAGSRSAVLALPHPKTAERRFVLKPLSDIAQDLHLPGLGYVKFLLDATSEQAESVMLVTHAVLSLRS